MIVIITGATHTGKTLLAQKLLETCHYPYLSIDLLKMGLIRSGKTPLSPHDDKELEIYLWPIVREMITTALENGQHLIVEGGYIPQGWKDDFEERQLREIVFYCLVMSREYIVNNFQTIKKYENIMEKRLPDAACTMQYLIEENERYRTMCDACGYGYILIEKDYAPESWL